MAWAAEMKRVHARLREALDVARESHDTSGRDLLLHCWGFCLALSGHHRGEDDVLFPALLATYPDLADVLGQLRRDHAMIEHLLGAYGRALDRDAPREELERHLDGIGAVMESHFGHEERRLLPVLERLDLGAAVRDALGPLA